MSRLTSRATALLFIALLPAATGRSAQALGGEEPHPDVSIQIATPGHDVQGDIVLHRMLDANGVFFWGGDGERIPDATVAQLLGDSKVKTRSVTVQLESDSLPFEAVMRALERLKQAAPKDGSTIIVVSPDPVHPNKRP